MMSVSYLLSTGMKRVDEFWSKRLGILDRALSHEQTSPGSENVVGLLDASCYRFRCFIEQSLSELEFLNDKHNSDLSYLDLFTHVVRGYGSSANDALSDFKAVFQLGDITHLLANPSDWISRSESHIKQSEIASDAHSGSALLIRLSRLMGDGRKCILSISEGKAGESRFMFLFHTKNDLRNDYIDYIEAAFKVKLIRESLGLK